jgi:SAM-dependent methyltransferase
MQAAHAKELRCPRGDHGLILEAGARETSGDVQEGALVCPLDGARVPIRGAIPRFREDDGYAANFGEQWNRFRRTQLDRFNGTTLSRDRFYAGTGWTPAELEGARVLEVGCGAGRFTQILLEAGANVFALDYSSAVDACYANHGPHPRLCVVQADLYRMPFEPASFDDVFCYGVLQHTPDPRAAFLALAAFLKPGGRIAIDVYRKGWALAPHKSKYLWRPLTRRLPHPALFRAIQWYVPRWLPIDTRIKSLPRIGNALGMLIPCWNYADRPLTPSQQVEWAILDTFDALAPRYDLPQRAETVEGWFREAGLQDVSVRPGGNGLLGNGRAPRGRPC